MKRKPESRSDWAAVLSGGWDEAERAAAAPSGGGPARGAEAEAIERVLRETEAVRSEIRAAAASVNWDVLPAIVADRALAEAQPTGRGAALRGPAGWMAGFRMRPALAGLAAGLVVGAAAMYVAIKAPSRRPPEAGAYYASGEFLDRAELEMARRNTLDYLEKSQYVLLDVFESAGESPVRAAGVRTEQARDLLQKKKYLDAQLGTVPMAKAKALCDQIEMLFLELSQIDEELSAAELRKMRDFVEERQLFLKINLVKKELQSGV
jgi:hypothetical protein